MLLHLVCFRYKADVDASTQREHRERLGTLRDLDGVVDLQVGADVVRSTRSYDTGLSVTFRDRAALDTYATHPRHVPIAQFGAGLAAHVVSVDFEV